MTKRKIEPAFYCTKNGPCVFSGKCITKHAVCPFLEAEA